MTIILVQFISITFFAGAAFLALEVSPEALRLLAASPTVLRIQADRVVRPQGGTTP